jgi:hypothetical protein
VVVERFGSLKNDGIFKITQAVREHMQQDVTACKKHLKKGPLNVYQNTIKSQMLLAPDC